MVEGWKKWFVNSRSTQSVFRILFARVFLLPSLGHKIHFFVISSSYDKIFTLIWRDIVKWAFFFGLLHFHSTLIVRLSSTQFFSPFFDFQKTSEIGNCVIFDRNSTGLTRCFLFSSILIDLLRIFRFLNGLLANEWWHYFRRMRHIWGNNFTEKSSEFDSFRWDNKIKLDFFR